MFINKLVSTKTGDVEPGWGTGFLYRRTKDVVWLVTNWHVLTGRRPDDPGMLLTGYSDSPDRIDCVFAMQERGQFSPPLTMDLYPEGRPIWVEYKREELGIDLAAIPIRLPSGAAGITVEDFAEHDQRAFEPGIDVIIVGYPFKHSIAVPFPVWKRAMIASEPGFFVMGSPQTLVDSPGRPGMSGSPIFRSGRGFSVTREQHDAMKAFERGEASALDIIGQLSVEQMADETVTLTFVGVYAGATGHPHLEHMNLGRMFIASLLDLIVNEGEPGKNPFPPSSL